MSVGVSENPLLHPKIFEKIRENYSMMKDSLDKGTSQNIADSWLMNDLISPLEHNKIRETHLSHEQAALILNLLLGGTGARYEVLLDVLQESNLSLYDVIHVADFEATVNKPRSKDEPDTFDMLVDNLASPPASLSNLHKFKSEIEITIKPTTDLEMVANFYSVSKDVYSPSDMVRGTALLVCNTKFDKNLNPRIGAEHDLENLSRLFHELKFNVITYSNITRDQLINEINKQRSNKDCMNHGCFVLSLSTHSESRNNFYCSDGSMIGLAEIMDMLDNNNFPYMAGKPKLLFIESSSGEARDKGVPRSRNMAAPREVLYANRSSFKLDLDGLGVLRPKPVTLDLDFRIEHSGFARESNKFKSQMMGVKSDFVVAFATFEGYVSYRRYTHGCWFSRVIVEVFQQHACDCEILELLQIVRKKMAHVETKYGCKQTNMTLDTLTKRFYFFPGLTNAD